MRKATEKQLVTQYICRCGNQFTDVQQVQITHKQLKLYKATKHKKDCYSKKVNCTECDFCYLNNPE